MLLSWSAACSVSVCGVCVVVMVFVSCALMFGVLLSSAVVSMLCPLASRMVWIALSGFRSGFSCDISVSTAVEKEHPVAALTMPIGSGLHEPGVFNGAASDGIKEDGDADVTVENEFP